MFWSRVRFPWYWNENQQWNLRLSTSFSGTLGIYHYNYWLIFLVSFWKMSAYTYVREYIYPYFIILFSFVTYKRETTIHSFFSSFNKDACPIRCLIGIQLWMSSRVLRFLADKFLYHYHIILTPAIIKQYLILVLLSHQSLLKFLVYNLKTKTGSLQSTVLKDRLLFILTSWNHIIFLSLTAFFKTQFSLSMTFQNSAS